jgi:SAM-dependent methyltransferase
MLTRQELEVLLSNKGARLPFLDFKPRSTIVASKPIVSRVAATKKSLEKDVLNEIAGLEGSPSFEVIDSIVELLKNAGILPELSGIGVEIGSGLGLLSAAFINQDCNNQIAGILALEAGFPFAETGIKLAAESTLGSKSYKILPSYGSFDEIGIDAGAIDFVIQIEALHHADDLIPPLVEAHRILKSGGFFISIDRSWPNSVARSVLEELLDHRYSEDWLEAKGFPSDKPFSRRDNGEHEYRDLDWNNAFEQVGFVYKRFAHLHPQFKFWHFQKRLVGILKLNRIAKIKIPSRSGVFRGFILGKIKINSRLFRGVIESSHPRPLTVSVWQKT